MKKLIYTLGLSILLGGTADAAESYTCATPPSCDSLGYTLTSTANCVGTVLKCPFDTSKYYCTQKKEVLSNMQLDWSKRKSFGARRYYYPTQYGCVFGVVVDQEGVGGAITINGVAQSITNKGGEYAFIYFCAGPGDSIYIQSIEEVRIDFVPFKGN